MLQISEYFMFVLAFNQILFGLEEILIKIITWVKP